jgi:hypothetical protein
MRASRVIFNEADHTYFLDGKQLQGVTGILKRNLFTDKYSDVPESVLMKAAERGTKIHEACRMADMFGVIECDEAARYVALCRSENIRPIGNEYLVSDEQNYATMIDMVDADYNLYDIKTTAVLDEEYLSWQLSINAHLFEIQNPNLKAGKLFGIWLRNGEAKLVQVKKIDKETIETLLYCDQNGLPFIVEKPANVEDAIQKLSDLEQIIIVQKAEIEAIEKRQEDLKAFLLEQMEKAGVKKWETGNIAVTYVAPSTRVTIDSKRLKEEEPEIYNSYAKVTETKRSLRIKIK